MLQFKEVLGTCFSSDIEGTGKGEKIFKETITDRINFFSNSIELYEQFGVLSNSRYLEICKSRGNIYIPIIKKMNFQYFHTVGNKNFISDNVFKAVSYGFVGRGGKYLGRGGKYQRNMYFYEFIYYKRNTYCVRALGCGGRGNIYASKENIWPQR